MTDLETRKSELEKEAANVRATINNLLPLCGKTPDVDDLSQLGFTDAIRRTFESYRNRMSANDVKEELSKKGFDLTGYKSPMASIYRILKRLEEKGEIESETEGFSVYYKGKRRLRYAIRRRRMTAKQASAGSSETMGK